MKRPFEHPTAGMSDKICVGGIVAGFSADQRVHARVATKDAMAETSASVPSGLIRRLLRHISD